MAMICPYLYYRDAEKAQAWLEQTIGFKTLAVYPGDNDTIRYSELSLGSNVIMMATAKPEEGKYSTLDLKGPSYSTYIAFIMDDFEMFYNRAKSAGAKITKEPYNTAYGSQEFEVQDPEGNTWFLGTYVPKVTA